MKIKNMFLIAAMLLLSSVSFAQDYRFGVKGGLNISSEVGADVHDDMEPRLLSSFGLAMDYKINKMFSVQSELLFSMRGAEVKTSIATESGTSELEMKRSSNYLEIPVIAKYNFDAGKNTKINIFAGPSLAILLDSEVETNGKAADNKDQMTGTDWGIVLGLGAEFGDFTIDGRYNFGLTEIIDEGEYDGKSNNMTFMVGYYFY